MEDKVPYIVHEGDMARLERVNKRQHLIIIIVIIALLATNAGWLYYESQFFDVETTSVAQTVETGDSGEASINGDVNINGKGAESSNSDQN